MPVGDRDARRLARTAALLVLGASLGWAFWLLAFGGFDRVILGVRVRSNNPDRVLVVSAVALIGYVLAGGRIRIAPLVLRVRSTARTLARHPGWIAWAVAAAAVIVAAINSTRIAGGADAYGYVSQAQLWLAGDLKVEQPWVADAPWPNAQWTFAPLGYRPAEGEWAIVPTYSPGLPMLMAAAAFVGGPCALFAIVPLSLGVGVLATYGLGVRLRSPWTGAIAAWFVATSPVVLEVAVESLTDVPAMAAWSLAFLFMLSDRRSAALAAGFCAGIAILIRPNLVPLIVPFVAWYVIRRDGGVRSGAVPAAVFLGGALPGLLAVAAINQYLYGSPGQSGYGSLSGGFAWTHVVPNLRRFVAWIVETQTPLALLGLAALAIPSRRVWPRIPDRRIFIAIGLFIALLWAQYSAYLEFDSPGYLRFLLPSWPFMMLGVASVLLAIARLDLPAVRAFIVALVIGLGAWGIQVALRRDVFEQRQAARHEAPLGRLMRRHTEPQSVIFALHRSGSLRYYAGRITARYDMLDPQWLDRSVAWLKDRGVHVYAVLDEREAREARERFAGQRMTSALDRPVLIYQPAGTALFDLSDPLDPSRQPVVVADALPDLSGCDPPVEAPPPLLLSTPPG